MYMKGYMKEIHPIHGKNLKLRNNGFIVVIVRFSMMNRRYTSKLVCDTATI